MGMIRQLSRRATVRVIGRGTWARAANGVALLILAGYGFYFATAGAHAGDAHAYWAADFADPYTSDVNEEDAYLYSPAFLLAIAPLKLLPWEGFWIAWIVIGLAALAWTVGPVLGVMVLLPGPYSPIWVNFWYGNIGVLMAAALVLGFRFAGAWSFLILTKVTPGIGLAWYAARREWKPLLRALAISLAIAAVSFAITPSAWFEWPGHLAQSSGQPDVFTELPPLWLRLSAAGAIAALGGLFSARWAVPLAAVLAQPVFWFTGFSMLIAWLGLVRHRRWLTDDAEVADQTAGPKTPS